MALKLFGLLSFGDRAADRRLKCPRPRRVIRNRCRRARARAFFAPSQGVGGRRRGWRPLVFRHRQSQRLGSVPLPDDNTRPFDIHGIALGMTAEAIRDSHPRISMRWRHDGGHVGEFVEIRRDPHSVVSRRLETGPGITASVIARSFQPDARGSRSRAVSPGSSARRYPPFAARRRIDQPTPCPAPMNGGPATEICPRGPSRDITGPSGDSMTVLTVTATDIDVAEALSQAASAGRQRINQGF